MNTKEYVHRALIAGAIGVIAALTVLYTRVLANTLLVLFAGLLLAVFLNGLAGLLRDRIRVPHGAAVALAVGISLLLLVGLGWWVGPPVAEQMSGLPERLSAAVGQLAAALEGTRWGRLVIDHLGSGPTSGAQGMLGGAMGAFSTVAETMANVLIIFFLGLFVAAAPAAYARPLLVLLPEGGPRRRGRQVLRTVINALERWLAGRIASMAIVGILTTVALLVAGVPLALALGIIAGLLSFVPFLGPIAAAVPAVLVGLGEGMHTVLVVVVIYSAVQAVESYLITPLIQQRAVSLPPAAILVAQAVVGLLFGLVGVLVATPLALTMVVLVQTLYLEDQLHQDVEPAGS